MDEGLDVVVDHGHRFLVLLIHELDGAFKNLVADRTENVFPLESLRIFIRHQKPRHNFFALGFRFKDKTRSA